MDNKNSNSKFSDNVWAGIIGGLTAAFTNFILENNKKSKEDEWHFQDTFESFSGAYDAKLEGYKLKYDIDDSTVKPKYVNVVSTYDWLYTISVGTFKTNTIEWVSPSIIPQIIEVNISDTFDEYLYQGMIIFNTSLLWVNSIKTEDYLTITISDWMLDKK